MWSATGVLDWKEGHLRAAVAELKLLSAYPKYVPDVSVPCFSYRCNTTLGCMPWYLVSDELTQFVSPVCIK